MSKRLHKDVEIEIEPGHGHGRRVFHSFDEAAAHAVDASISLGVTINMDVLVWSEAGARSWGGDEAVEEYREDPDASVFDRIEVTANPLGRIS